MVSSINREVIIEMREEPFNEAAKFMWPPRGKCEWVDLKVKMYTSKFRW